MNDLRSLVDSGTQSMDVWRWGRIISVSPLKVRLDTDTDTLDVNDSLVPLTAGDRVRCHLYHRRLTVVGRRETVVFPVDGGLHQVWDVTFIAGVPYVSSGSVLVPAFSWARAEPPVYIATLNMPIPYVPPTGWTFAWSVQESGGWTYAQNGGRFPVGGTHAVRVTQFINESTTVLKRLQWQLVRA